MTVKAVLSPKYQQILDSWVEFFNSNENTKPKTKQTYIQRVNKKLLELDSKTKSHPGLEQVIFNQLDKMTTMKELQDFNPQFEEIKNNYVDLLLKEGIILSEKQNLILPVTQEQINAMAGHPVEEVIFMRPVITHTHEQIDIHGVKINGTHVKISDLFNMSLHDQLKEHLVQILKYAINEQLKASIGQNDVKSIYTFINGKLVSIGDTTPEQTIDAFLKQYYASQSNDEWYEVNKMDSLDVFRITHVLKYNTGKHYVEDEAFETLMGATIQLVKNTDDRCLYAALFIALVIRGKFENTYIVKEFNNVQFGNKCFQRELVNYSSTYNGKPNLLFYTNQMYQMLNPENQQLEQEEVIKRFTEKFNINVCIVDMLVPQQKLPQEKDIILLHHNSHYSVIKTYQQAIRNIRNKQDQVYCFTHQVWSDKKKKCPICFGYSYCSFCLTYHFPSQIKEVYQCEKCNKSFQYKPTEECLQKHAKTCDQNKECQYCKEIHQEKYWCAKKIEFGTDHFKAGKIKKTKCNFMTYDIESLFKSCPENSKYRAEHIPFLICYDVITYNKNTEAYEFQNLEHDNNLFNLPNEGKGNYIISENPFEKFLEILNLARAKFDIKYVFAHNGGKYDTVLLLSYIINNNVNIKFDTLINNGKLMSLTLELQAGIVVIKDSILLLTEPLKKFNKSYGLTDIAQHYNFQEAYKYEQSYTFLTSDLFKEYLRNGGQSATIKQYSELNLLKASHFNDMSQQQFTEYVQIHGDKDFVNNYIVYCQQDVKILSLGLIKMSELTFQHEGANMLEYLTISSLAYNLYLANSGDRMFQQGAENFNYNRSNIEKQFQCFLQNKDNLKLANEILETSFKIIDVVATNKKYDNYNVDMIIQTDLGNYILEVDGVFYHGLLELPESNKYYLLMLKRRQHHIQKHEYLEKTYAQKGFMGVLHVTDKTLQKHIKKTPFQPLIANREVFKGGRTEYYFNYCKWNPEQYALKGFDLTSLYPSMMLHNLPLRGRVIGLDKNYIEKLIKYALQIRGTPEERLVQYIKGCDEQKRLIQVKCELLPPQDLLMPVISVTINKKFLSPLCRTCAELQCKDVSFNEPCKHTDEQRMLIGFFDEVELIAAINNGYQLLNPTETHVYQVTSHNDPEFKGNNFIKRQIFMKTLYSSPADYNDQVLRQLQQDGVIHAYQIDGQKILIKQSESEDFQQITSNPAMKSLYKLFMNSTYGKTGQNKIRSSHEIGNYDFLFQKYDQQLHDNLQIDVVNENKVIYSYELAEEIQQLDSCQSNASLAGRITALSRVVLYQLQQHIKVDYQGIVLYSDTDSVYCLVPKKYENVPGFSLKTTFGIKSEEKLQQTFEFCCIAPKQYAYQNASKSFATSKGLTCMSKGYVKDVQNNELVPLFEIYKNLVLQTKTCYEVEQNKNFEKDPHTLKIYQMDQTKKIQVQERKRVSLERQIYQQLEYIYTVPFGYVAK